MCTRLFGFNVGDQCIGHSQQTPVNVSQESIAEITNSLFESYHTDFATAVLNPSTTVQVSTGHTVDCQDSLKINRVINPAYVIDKTFAENHAADIRRTVIHVLTRSNTTLRLQIDRWRQDNHETTTLNDIVSYITNVVNASLTNGYLIDTANRTVRLDTNSPPNITSLYLNNNLSIPNCHTGDKIPVTIYIANLMTAVNNRINADKRLTNIFRSLNRYVNSHPDLPINYINETGKMLPVPIIVIIVLLILFVIGMLLYSAFR